MPDTAVVQYGTVLWLFFGAQIAGCDIWYVRVAVNRNFAFVPVVRIIYRVIDLYEIRVIRN